MSSNNPFLPALGFLVCKQFPAQVNIDQKGIRKKKNQVAARTKEKKLENQEWKWHFQAIRQKHSNNAMDTAEGITTTRMNSLQSAFSMFVLTEFTIQNPRIEYLTV